MIKRLFLRVALGVIVSGCFMAPLALVGPATSGFSTASIIQSGITTGANYMVKKSTGKTIAEHVVVIITRENVYEQTFVPTYKTSIAIILPKSKPVR